MFATLPSMRARQPTSLRSPLKKVLLILVAVLLLAYPVDWMLWRLRMLTGNGMDAAVVTETTAATLKGNHYEVYSQETTSVNCSRSLLPEAGAGPCWWLHRHPQIVTQY